MVSNFHRSLYLWIKVSSMKILMEQLNHSRACIYHKIKILDPNEYQVFSAIKFMGLLSHVDI